MLFIKMIMQGIQRQKLSILKRTAYEQSVKCAINGQKVKILKHLPHVFYTENKTGNLHSLVPHYKRMLHRIILHKPYFSIHSHIIIGNKHLQKCLVHRYSKSPLIWHLRDREVLDYQTVPMLTEVFTDNFLPLL